MKRSLINVALLAVSSMYLGGCLLGPQPDDSDNDIKKYRSTGSAYFEEEMAKAVANDIANISQNCAGTSSFSLKKASAGGELSIRWQPWTFKGEWWTRNGEIAGKDNQGNSLTLVGIDSVQYIVSGSPVQVPLQVIGLDARARRHNEITIDIPSSGTALLKADYILEAGVAVEGNDTVLTLSGTATGYIFAQNTDNSESLKINSNAEARGVKCTYIDGAWSAPYSGTIVINSPYKTFTISYEKETAEIVIEGKAVDSSPKTITVDIQVE